MEEKRPQVYLNIDEEDEDSGMSRISFVDKPATQLVWNMFSTSESPYDDIKEEKFEVKDSKQIITAPVMLAETPIRRFNPIFGEYDALFTEDTIFNMMKKYFIENKINNINEQHDPTKIVDGVFLIESFIVGDRATSMLYPNVNKGSWMATFYIQDKEYYEKLMNENFNGFSLEGKFIEEYENNMIGKLYQKVNDILESDLPDLEKENQIKKLLNIL